MTALIQNAIVIELSTAKTGGLAALGVPVDDSTEVKKGKAQEFLQNLETGAIARRYQNLRITAVKTTEAGRPVSKIFAQFEVFGDDWTSVGDNTGIALALKGGDGVLLELPYGPLFLPYCRSWYENQYEHTISEEVFDQLTAVEFIAKTDELQPG